MRCAVITLLAMLPTTWATADAIHDLAAHVPPTPALVVVVCRGDTTDIATVRTLVEKTPWTILVHATASDPADMRQWARDRNVLGRRVWIIADNDDALWLADDMADAVWVASTVVTRPPTTELMRVAHPGGVVISNGNVKKKMARRDVDQWSHPYRSPDNNVVSHDRVARLPGALRFQTRPVFAPMPNQTLFAGGRIFFFSGHIAFHVREEPLLNQLTVLNAYNGLPLWQRPLDPTTVVHNVAKFATDREVVYAEGPTLWRLDAASGTVVGKHPVPGLIAKNGDTDWKWLAHQGDHVWAAFGPPDAHVQPHRRRWPMGHWPWSVANERYQPIVNNFGAARSLALFRYPEMELVWTTRETEPFDARTLCIDGTRLFALAPMHYMVARATDTGRQLWRQTPQTEKILFATLGEALHRQGWGLGWATYCLARAGNDIVCIAGPAFRKTIGIDQTTGRLRWSLPIESPHAFFLGGALYVVPRVAARTANCQQLDPQTGKVLHQFSLGVIGSCTRLTATDTQFFYRPGGGEGRTVYVNVGERRLADYEGIVRPGCFDGVVPAFGRLYWMPLACDCWQTHGTFSMAPRKPVTLPAARADSSWAHPTDVTPAGGADWPCLRADPTGSCVVETHIPLTAQRVWHTSVTGAELTPPVVAAGHVLVGAGDGTATSLDATNGKVQWQCFTEGSITAPPTYWQGRAVVGSCDGSVYCIDAKTGQLLGHRKIAPENRLINVMNRLMSAWPVSGGVMVNDEGMAYTAAGCTAADGTVVEAIDLHNGRTRWRQLYSPDPQAHKPSFGVQGNLLYKNGTLFVQGGAPVGMIAVNATTGTEASIITKLEAGSEVFLEPGDQPIAMDRELYSHERTRTTIFKKHQGHIYFTATGCHIALIQGRLFCAEDTAALDRLVARVNTDPRTGGKLIATTVPWNVMKLPVDKAIRWAGDTADVQGIAVGNNGLVVLHEDQVEGISLDGKSLWRFKLAAKPLRWGLALAAGHCYVTLTNGGVVCVGAKP